MAVVAQGTVVPATPQALYVSLPYQLTVGAKTTPGAFVQLDSGDYMDVSKLATWTCSTPGVGTLTWTPGTMPPLAATGCTAAGSRAISAAAARRERGRTRCSDQCGTWEKSFLLRKGAQA